MSKKRIKAVRFGSHTLGWRWELPATAEAYGRMVEQMALGIRRCWPGTIADEAWLKEARAALRAIGITPPARQARKGLQKGQP